MSYDSGQCHPFVRELIVRYLTYCKIYYLIMISVIFLFNFSTSLSFASIFSCRELSPRIWSFQWACPVWLRVWCRLLTSLNFPTDQVSVRLGAEIMCFAEQKEKAARAINHCQWPPPITSQQQHNASLIMSCLWLCAHMSNWLFCVYFVKL